MQTKGVKYSFKGVQQDVVDAKNQPEFLYEANNIRFNTTDKTITGSISFEKGNKLIASIPNIEIIQAQSKIVYGTNELKYTSGNEIDTQLNNNLLQTTSSNIVIIGHAVARDSVILFTTDDNGMDAIWKLNNDVYTIELLYLRNLGFNINNPIQAIFNYENENIQKVYWVDGINQIRNINITHNQIEDNELLINIRSTSINFVGEVSLSQPKAKDKIGGGTHKAGMIQYAYNLFNLNGSQTKVSPLSNLVSLDNGVQGGGEVNEVVKSTVEVTIDNIDTSYSFIRLYAIKYTSFNEIPSISLISEKEVGGNTTHTIQDTGNVISTLSLAEFTFLGSNPVIAKHIETKDNNLFLFNLQTKEFVLPKELDTRAYSFPQNTNRVYVANKIDDVFYKTVTAFDKMEVTSSYNVPLKYSAINMDYVNNRYQFNSSILGGEGKYLKYEIVQNSTIDPKENRVFKDNEIYRIGIQFYNKLGQVSLANWIADFKAPEGNLSGNYNTLKVTLKPEFYVWLNNYNFKSDDDKPVGFKIIRVDRTVNDKTIICQGSLNGMMSNTANFTNGPSNDSLNPTTRLRYEAGRKMPSLQRIYDNSLKPMIPMRDGYKLNPYATNAESLGQTKEVLHANKGGDRRADTFQYNKLIQLYSPEVTFGNVSLTNGLHFRVVGAYESSYNAYWGAETGVENKKNVNEGKVLNNIHPKVPGANKTSISGNVDYLMDLSMFAPHKSKDNMEFMQFYREFNGPFHKATDIEYAIYGTPELVEKGQSSTFYNGDSNFEFYNTLEPMLTDQFKDSDGAHKEGGDAITSVNSFGAKNLTIVEGSQSRSAPLTSRKTLDQIFNATGITARNSILLAELIVPLKQVYFGSIYGGNLYEDKKRNSYLEIGEYTKITTGNDSVTINSPGDTYVQQFRLLKISKTDTEVWSDASLQMSEIIEFKVETTVDLKNRNDLSLSNWDSRFQPREDEYHKYNRVYSQQPTLMKTTNVDTTFRRINNFDTRIQATRTKIPNESVDSWTDLLENEILDLDGKYGPINGVVSYRDQIYTFQDNGFAAIAINPRVQTQATDGISIELGRGNKLYDYQYLSTTTGSLNKWGIKATQYGIYFLDGLNKRYYRFGESLEPLSEIKGHHAHFTKNYPLEDLKIDNPIIGKGVSIGYDALNNDVYLTVNNNLTLCFNEIVGEFTGYYSYNSPMYIYNKEVLLTINSNTNNTIYETHAGDYNIFYGINKKSNIIFIANPESDVECIFNNLEYKSEALDINNIEQRYTWEYIRAYNEFQDSGLKPLNQTNIRKLNRKYRLTIPRNQNSTDRIRNNWTYIELESFNPNKYFYKNNDIILYYIPNYIMIQ